MERYAGIKIEYQDKLVCDILWSGYLFINNIIIDFLKERKTTINHKTSRSLSISMSFQDLDILQAVLSKQLDYEFWRKNSYKVDDMNDSASIINEIRWYLDQWFDKDKSQFKIEFYEII